MLKVSKFGAYCWRANANASAGVAKRLALLFSDVKPKMGWAGYL